jgi:nitric oxide reductase activation protein
VDEKAVPALLDGVRLRVDDESPGEDEGEDEGEESEPIGKLVKLFSSPLVNPLMAALMKRLGGGGQSSSGTGSGDIVRTKRSKSPLGARTRVSMSPDGLVPTQVVDSRGWGWRYPEWDVQARRYRMDWCTVIEAVPHPEDARAFAPPRNPDLRRRLVRLGVGLEHRRRQPSGDDIDVDAAVDSRVDFLAGCTPDDGVYVENQRRRRSLSVLVLLDVSGSLAEAGSAHGSAHEQQRQAAAMLTDTLHGLGDRVALYGFRSHGRSSVYLLRVKGFGDPMDGATYERLGGLSPSGYTRLGAGIRHSAHLLATQGGTDRRLLVLLSDGFPYEDGYQGPYAEADARRALAETRRRGIGCLCLTLGASTPRDSLGRVFGAAAHASAPRLEDLTSQIGPLFRSAMASAGTQRRIAQRHRPSPRRPRGNR